MRVEVDLFLVLLCIYLESVNTTKNRVWFHLPEHIFLIVLFNRTDPVKKTTDLVKE